jgi:hypothetical protein
MRLTELEALSSELRTLLAAAGEAVERFTAQIHEARAENDPFAALYFAARKAYRRELGAAKKSGNNVEREVWSSYRKAHELGFKGSAKDWEELLRLCLRNPAR